VTAAWVKAVDAGDAAVVAALYAEDAHSMPPGGSAITGRSAIETYWREDLGSGGVVTSLTPRDSIAQGGLLHVDGTYEVAAKDTNVPLARGQYQQLWKQVDGQWKVHDEIWRLDPALQRDPRTAERLTSLWTTAYNAADAPALMALYDENAELATQPTGSVIGRDAIGSFWKDDFGDGKSATILTLTDVYVAADLAHLEGGYSVSDKGVETKGRYVQLWMRDGNEWRIHREMWWR
jgi:ketosteroid isomerase-like protein